MKAYDENAKYILFTNKSITILSCSTVNSLTISFWDIFPNRHIILELWKSYIEECHSIHNEAVEDLISDLTDPHSLTDKSYRSHSDRRS